jgi:hypothetical protein
MQENGPSFTHTKKKEHEERGCAESAMGTPEKGINLIRYIRRLKRKLNDHQ